ncbi:LptF/LptG family permease [Desulforhabdus amnigena]|jgi:lipopolysaccharide export system permease protein|uniref:Membrane protein n=1 Tax=Desulforhabdus amnigena TaxID=40218 RepID=A0A9W6D3C0_9BACT|nr:LptF/LptG family permease [Desulforhabdus amnigena]NLJ26925.1 LptF/LptG family permease [Deltaproteobacteria bacterium]GLI34513.1 membrane protein [Desulforhabdus amnigena]
MGMTLYRYILKEQIFPLSICLLGLSFVLVTGRMLQLARYLFTSSVTFLDLAGLMVLAMPKLLTYTLPMATLMGILLAFVRINGDNELIALRAAGISFKQLFPPVAIVLLLTTFLSFYNMLSIIPTSSRAFESKLKSLGRASLPLLLREGVFIDTIPDLVFFFRNVDPSHLTIKGILVQDQREPKVRVTIVAEHAQIVYQKNTNRMVFKMYNGIITRVPDDFQDAQAVTFRDYNLVLSLDEIFGTSPKDSKGKTQMTFREVLEKIHQPGQNPDVRYLMELHQRIALPMGCLILGLVAPPLGAMFRQKGRMTGITLAVGIFLAYYVVLSAGKGLCENGLLPASLAIWTPNILTLGIAAYLWFKLQRETPFESSLWRRAYPIFQKILRLLGFHKECKS